MRIIVVFFILTVFSAHAEYANEKGYIFDHLDPGIGISQSTISDFVQDDDDFIWIATYNGLYRYDGNSFRKYKNLKDTLQMRSYYIKSLFVDSKKRMWVCSNDGLGVYVKKNGNVLDINSLTDSGYDLQQIEDILEMPNGDIWFCTTTGLYVYSYGTNAYRKVPVQYKNFPYLKISNIEPVSDSLFYMTALNKLYSFNIYTQHVALIHSFTEHDHIRVSTDLTKVYADNLGNLWLRNFSGASYVYTIKTGHIQQLHFNLGTIIYDMIQETDSTYLFSIDGVGLLRYNVAVNKYQRIFDLTDSKKKIKNNKINSIFIDKQNILWVGHIHSGIGYTYLTHSGFYSITPLNEPDMFPIVSSVLSDSDGNLWIGTDGGGVLKYSKDRKIKTLYKNNPADKHSLPSNAVLAFFEDSKHEIWIGTYNGGMARYNKKDDNFIVYNKSSESMFGIYANDVRKFIEDRFGNLWIITHGHGISHYMRNKDSFVNYSRTANWSNSILNNWTYDMAFDEKGYLWITTSRGVSCFDTLRKEFTNYEKSLDYSNGLVNNLIYTMHYDSKGNLWFGTALGLHLFDYETEKFVLYTHEGGLSEEVICSIEEDNAANLWISTSSGLYKFNPEGNTSVKYTINDGLQGNEYTVNASFKGKDGILYFGGTRGLSYFNPNEIFFNQVAPKVQITTVEVEGESLPLHLLDSVVTLSHDKKFFTFGYVALNYINSQKNRYKYMLEGLENTWSDVTGETKTKYTSLPPGKYTFMVKGSNNDGVWADSSTNFSFEILPPWWKTWWFRILGIVMLGGSVSLYFLLKMRQIKIINAQLEAKVKKRTVDLEWANSHLEKQNVEIEKQKGILQEQNEQLKESKFEIQATNEELLVSNELLAQKEEELKKKNDILEELVKTKDKVLSIIAHDLRNPINVIIGYSDLMIEKISALSPESLKKFILAMKSSSENANTLLDNLLNWARSQTGNIKLDLKVQDTFSLVKETVDIIKPSAVRKNISIRTYVGDQINSYAFVDSMTFSTIIRNILSNAIKFTYENGQINIYFENEGNDFFLIKIEDNGVGMSKEQLDKLYKIERYNTTAGTKNETGTGLGLILCKEFVGMNNGEIAVESELGKGTCFIIKFPRQMPDSLR